MAMRRPPKFHTGPEDREDPKGLIKTIHRRNAAVVLLWLLSATVLFVFILSPTATVTESESSASTGGAASLNYHPKEGSTLIESKSSDSSRLRGIEPHSPENPITIRHQRVDAEDDGCVATDDMPRRHIVPPPAGDVTIVCCQSTKGPITIEVHPSWAPIGSRRFLDMVENGFFSTKIPLFRALKSFLIQFGLSSDPNVQREWNRKGELRDDPPWLPQGPPGRQINGTKRFRKGYLAYAGAGKDSRGTQLIVALEDNGPLGGAMWEVPWGQLIGQRSFDTIDRVYTGYAEAVSQGKIQNRGMDYLSEFPELDYITGCRVTDRDVSWKPILTEQ